MKKTILLILAVLPIVLLVIIAFAGQILSLYQHISVERVEVINEVGDPYTDKMMFKVNQGESKDLTVRIYPELASNKAVTFTSNDENICTVDENGVVTGVNYGFTTIIVKTVDGGKTFLLYVKVTADIPIDITLSENELMLIEGQQYVIDATVELYMALDKSVIFTSSDPNVAMIDVTGKITAISEGTAVITATTVSGGLTDTCTVTVVPGSLPVIFDFKEAEDVQLVNGLYLLSNTTINLKDYLVLGEGVSMADVKIKLLSGDGVVLEDGVLTFSKAGIVNVRAYIGDESNPDAMTEIKVAFR